MKWQKTIFSADCLRSREPWSSVGAALVRPVKIASMTTEILKRPIGMDAIDAK